MGNNNNTNISSSNLPIIESTASNESNDNANDDVDDNANEQSQRTPKSFRPFLDCFQKELLPFTAMTMRTNRVQTNIYKICQKYGQKYKNAKKNIKSGMKLLSQMLILMYITKRIQPSHCIN